MHETPSCAREVVRLTSGARRQMREDPRFHAGRMREALRHRHVAHGALVFDLVRLIGMIEHLSPDGRLPVRVTRGIGHDRAAPVGADRHVLAR